MGEPSVRIHLAGRLSIEADGIRADQQDFPGNQGRLAFAYLVCERGHPVARHEVAHALWPEKLPTAWDSALSAIISKLRAVIATTGLNGANVLTNSAGCYDLQFPGDVWVDLEVATDSIHDAEVAIRSGDLRAAYGPSAIAHHIARRPFLPGIDSPWIDSKRDKLRSILVRALECRAQVYLWNREYTLAVEAAKEVVSLEPFRETGCQLLMRGHAATGNVADALLAYERCRRLLAEELGVSPSVQTRAIHDEFLALAR